MIPRTAHDYAIAVLLALSFGITEELKFLILYNLGARRSTT
jgi:hypothetical protein